MEISVVTPPPWKTDFVTDKGPFRDYYYLKCLFVAGALGALLSLFAVGIQNVSLGVTKEWVNCDYKTDVNCGQLYQGKLYWIAILGRFNSLVKFGYVKS